jgi:type IV secretion system protein VirB3
MLFGVPMVPMVLVAGFTFLGVVWLGLLVAWWAAVITLFIGFVATLTMRGITKKDDQRLRQYGMRFLLRLKQGNHGHWKAMSFSPIRYKKRQ